ncbi:MAG: right-handed parallel beta-helix repeat-containing protein, partial [Chloroflexota bacterium]|nr:right-handed parallel beta-helix repeat-containing protein [Chloroflexota bacterium]
MASTLLGAVVWLGGANDAPQARAASKAPALDATILAARPSVSVVIYGGGSESDPRVAHPHTYQPSRLANLTTRPPGVPLATLYVDRNGNCPNVPCYTTIQTAVTAANPGDTINVTAGLYYETVTVNKSLILRGAQAGNDARVGRTDETAETVLNKDTGGFDLTSGPSNVTIDGFLIEGASGPNGNARGIFILGGSGYQVLNNILRYNSMGAFFSSDGTVQTRFYRNRVENNNNTPTGDGDTGLFGGSGPVNNVLIDSNQFAGNSSAGFTNVPSSPSSNLIITNNSSTGDGTFAALFSTSATQIISNTVTGAQGSAIYLGGNNSGTLVSGNNVSNGPFSALRVDVFSGDTPNSNITANCNNLTANAYGIRISPGALITGTLAMEAHNNNIAGNTVAGARNDSTAVNLNATTDWWGSATGPTNPGNPGGTGDIVTGTVTFAPFLTNPASCIGGTPQP